MSMILRPAEERGHANHGWLDSRHSFSFAHYYDAAHMGFRALRVINEDVVRPGTGFGTHGHRDMEIISYVIQGELAHEDTTGGKEVLRRGDVQYMSAGTGLRHSELNASHQQDVHFLQIWILPGSQDLPPSYDQKNFPDSDKRNRLKLIAAPAGQDGALAVHQDVRVYAGLLEAGTAVSHALAAGRGAWVQVVAGTIQIGDVAMKAGDGIAIEDFPTIAISAGTDA
ncbi:MAG: pirin family protein, partial [Magnetospirillum sp.]|nr:pirin family protein [Magnetospirillum sp.]